jgi:hypothetical protein
LSGIHLILSTYKGEREDRFVLSFKSATVPSNIIEEALFISISTYDKAVYIRNKDNSKATVGRVVFMIFMVEYFIHQPVRIRLLCEFPLM